MVGADAGVVGTEASVVGAAADVGAVVVDADWICASSVVMAMKLSEPVVQVIWPMVNVRPFGVAMELGMKTILFVWRAVHTPPTWRAIVDKIWSVVYLGVCPR